MLELSFLLLQPQIRRMRGPHVESVGTYRCSSFQRGSVISWPSFSAFLHVSGALPLCTGWGLMQQHKAGEKRAQINGICLFLKLKISNCESQFNVLFILNTYFCCLHKYCHAQMHLHLCLAWSPQVYYTFFLYLFCFSWFSGHADHLLPFSCVSNMRKKEFLMLVANVIHKRSFS